MFFFAVGGFLALMMRLELLTPAGGDILDKNTYNVFIPLHGAIMIFMFIIPSVPAAMGNSINANYVRYKRCCFPKVELSELVCLCDRKFYRHFLNCIWCRYRWTFYTIYSSSTDTAVISDDICGICSWVFFTLYRHKFYCYHS